MQHLTQPLLRPLLQPLLRRATVLLLALGSGACASHNSADAASEPRPRVRHRSDLITQEEMDRKHWTNVYEMVSELHANWLNGRGPDTILGEPGSVQVQLDDVRLGDVSTLRSLPVMNIAFVQYFDPISASARWGLGYNHGAILVSTRSR
jgi:hypothetical protein